MSRRSRRKPFSRANALFLTLNVIALLLVMLFLMRAAGILLSSS